MKLKRIGLLGFDGVQALDLTGPAEAFAAATVEDDGDGPQRCYEVILIGLTTKCFVSADCHLIYKPHKTIHTAPPLDTLIIPGGPGLREPETNARVSAWVRNRASRIRRIATVCTGTYGLAATGLLDGRRVTTHWRYARDLAARFPKVNVDPNALYLKDGNFYTSAGLTAGIDLSLALIEEDFGSRAALAVARELVVYLKRPGGQEQYSEPLKFQTSSNDAFSELIGWMIGHLHHDLSVETLAAKACLGPRQFSRRFKNGFGTTPAAFVENLRLDEARQRLTMPNQNIESVAASVGFKSADVFRRAFERRYGITPGSYRKRFNLRSR
jgi:transcriptional regulator GlxA family with amidase domain